MKEYNPEPNFILHSSILVKLYSHSFILVFRCSDWVDYITFRMFFLYGYFWLIIIWNINLVKLLKQITAFGRNQNLST